jgi:hypothetical protein
MIDTSALFVTCADTDCAYDGEIFDSEIGLPPHSITTVEMVIREDAGPTDTIPPGVPENIQVTGTTLTSISIAWDPVYDSSGVEGYRVYIDDSFLESTPDTFIHITGLIPGTSYIVRVSAFDERGNESEPSPPEWVTTLTPDEDPPVLTFTDTVYAGEPVLVTSSEDGVVYLVPAGTPKRIDHIRVNFIDSMTVVADSLTSISMDGLENGTYWLYARDRAMNLSEPGEVILFRVGITSVPGIQLRVFPNPFIHTATVQLFLDKPQRIWYVITDYMGRELIRRTMEDLPAGHHKLNLERDGMAEGFYILKIGNSSGTVGMCRILIRD